MRDEERDSAEIRSLSYRYGLRTLHARSNPGTAGSWVRANGSASAGNSLTAHDWVPGGSTGLITALIMRGNRE
jgi:hypothetical protein